MFKSQISISTDFAVSEGAVTKWIMTLEIANTLLWLMSLLIHVDVFYWCFWSKDGPNWKILLDRYARIYGTRKCISLSIGDSNIAIIFQTKLSWKVQIIEYRWGKSFMIKTWNDQRNLSRGVERVAELDLMKNLLSTVLFLVVRRTRQCLFKLWLRWKYYLYKIRRVGLHCFYRHDVLRNIWRFLGVFTLLVESD